MDKWRGHIISCTEDKWIYQDTKQPVSEWKDRPCGHCKLSNTTEGHDGCIGALDGVMNACCGHGESRLAYIQYEDTTTVDGAKATTIINHTLLKEDV